MDAPSETEGYDRATFIEMLDDWGWSGDPSAAPKWLPSTQGR